MPACSAGLPSWTPTTSTPRGSRKINDSGAIGVNVFQAYTEMAAVYARLSEQTERLRRIELLGGQLRNEAKESRGDDREGSNGGAVRNLSLTVRLDVRIAKK